MADVEEIDPSSPVPRSITVLDSNYHATINSDDSGSEPEEVDYYSAFSAFNPSYSSVLIEEIPEPTGVEEEGEKIAKSFLDLFYETLNNIQDNKLGLQKKQLILKQLADLFTADAVFTCQGEIFRGAWIPPTLSYFLSSKLQSHHFVPLSVTSQPSSPPNSILLVVHGQAQLPTVFPLDIEVTSKDLHKQTRTTFIQTFLLVPQEQYMNTGNHGGGHLATNSLVRFDF